MIRCTPVCGPGPVLYWVSGLPLGSLTVNETVTGLPAWIVPWGAKPPSVNTFAAPTVGTLTVPAPELLPQPATASAQQAAVSASTAGRRVVGGCTAGLLYPSAWSTIRAVNGGPD